MLSPFPHVLEFKLLAYTRAQSRVCDNITVRFLAQLYSVHVITQHSMSEPIKKIRVLYCFKSIGLLLAEADRKGPPLPMLNC